MPAAAALAIYLLTVNATVSYDLSASTTFDTGASATELRSATRVLSRAQVDVSHGTFAGLRASAVGATRGSFGETVSGDWPVAPRTCVGDAADGFLGHLTAEVRPGAGQRLAVRLVDEGLPIRMRCGAEDDALVEAIPDPSLDGFPARLTSPLDATVPLPRAIRARRITAPIRASAPCPSERDGITSCSVRIDGRLTLERLRRVTRPDDAARVLPDGEVEPAR